MGVTLERVQNKFACIIGELCSEPVVLSQFAIWLDLRLSEYKAKGAISLECSGENPDPTWLKGHIPPVRTKPREVIPSRSPRSVSHHQSPVGFMPENYNNRLSPDIVVVKEEPSESVGSVGVFPVTLHKNNDMSMNRTATRKRTATESMSSEHSLSQSDSNFYHQPSSSPVPSSSKVRKVASPSESGTPPLLLEPVSESLMSIISGDLDGHIPEASQMMDSALETNLDNSALSTYHSVTASGGLGTSFNTSDSMMGSDTSNRTPEDYNNGDPLDVTLSSIAREVSQTLPHMSDPSSSAPQREREVAFWKHLPTKSARSRIPNIEGKAKSVIWNIAGAVEKLEGWLLKAYGDSRNIEKILPQELDAYLTEFFPIVKNKHGYDYDPDSFMGYRCYLDRFLKENNYPASLCRSREFLNSQVAFKARRVELVELYKRRKKLSNETEMVVSMAPDHTNQFMSRP